MKKLLALLLALAMVLSLAACSGKDGEEETDGGEKGEKSWRDLMEEGEALLDDEEYDDAVDVLSDAIDQRDGKAELYTLRGQAYLGKGGKSALKKAVKDFEQALELDEESEDAWVGLVQTLMAQEEYEDAADRAEEGLEILGSSRKLDRLLEDIGDELGSTPDDTEEPDGTTPPPPPEPPETEPPETEPPVPEHVHNWMDANYQQPRWCIECGETEGEPLTPDFERVGISCDLSLNVPVSYTVACSGNESFETTGTVTVTDYQVVSYDSEHPYEEGYEWRIATFQLYFYDQNAQMYGWNYVVDIEDYYNISLLNDTYEYDEDADISTMTVLYYGDLRDTTVVESASSSGWTENGDVTATFVVAAHVPEGYDGFVYGFASTEVNFNAALDFIYHRYPASDWLFFRFS